ncbi:MAG TPA: hypothetical protein O0X27_00980 [Methanocorpusculum sp.]|nr:hypothetical protein [Methanocorpusculum sp.]
MYAVIDIGSNTIRLSLYHVHDGAITLLANKKVTAGLAGYVQNGHMVAEGIRRGEEALSELTTFLSYVQVKKRICFATAPLRGIDNAEEVRMRFERICNAPVTILSGEEEAAIDFIGVKRNLADSEGLIVDIGGGSTELVYYVDGTVRSSCSIPVGSLVMYRNCVRDIIPTPEEMTRIRDTVSAALAASSLPDRIPVICGIGGTVRGCGRLLRHLLHDKKKSREYTPEDIAGLLGRERHALADFILREEPDRIHTIVPGACILLAIADRVQAKQVRVSRTGVREGCLMHYLESGEVN